MEENQLIVALDARTAITAGLVPDLAEGNGCRTDVPVIPTDENAVVVGSQSRHGSMMAVRAQQNKPFVTPDRFFVRRAIAATNVFSYSGGHCRRIP
jgi:hypothetical protein